MRTFKEYLEEENEDAEDQWYVYLEGGSVGEKREKIIPKDAIMSKDAAAVRKKSMNKMLSPGEKKYYRLKYVAVPVEKLLKKGWIIKD